MTTQAADLDHVRDLLLDIVRQSYSVERLAHALDEEPRLVSITLRRLKLAELGALVDNAHDAGFVLPNSAGA